MAERKVGDKIWIVDPGGRGTRISQIKGETSRSWLVDLWGSTYKIPKVCVEPSFNVITGDSGYGYETVWFDEEAMNEALWVENNRRLISEAVYDIKDARKLKNIANFIGYTPK